MGLLASIHNCDVITFGWLLQRKHRNLAVRISRAISFSADGPLYVAVGAGFIYLHAWYMVKLLALGFFIERSCYAVLKSFFKRNRPQAAIPGFKSVIEPADQFSLPSGHTSAAFLVATFVSPAIPGSAWLLYPWACSVGLARVTLGVHFPTDVLAGAMMGHLIATSLIGCIT